MFQQTARIEDFLNFIKKSQGDLLGEVCLAVVLETPRHTALQTQ